VNIVSLDKLDIDVNTKKQPDFLTKIYSGLDDLLNKDKLMNYYLPMSVAIGSWTLDPNCKSSSITLSSDLLKATKSGSSGHVAVCGTQALEAGKHVWSVTVSGLAQPNGDWIQFGLVDKSENGNMEAFTLESCWSVTSAKYYGNVTRMEKTGECSEFDGQKWVCRWDADEGKFEIEGNGMKAEVSGLKGKKLYPFVNLWEAGNSVVIGDGC